MSASENLHLKQFAPGDKIRLKEGATSWNSARAGTVVHSTPGGIGADLITYRGEGARKHSKAFADMMVHHE